MIPHHPEIEDDGFIGNLLDNHEGQSAERTSVDVLEVRGDVTDYRYHADDQGTDTE
jgi:hypothetical protein